MDEALTLIASRAPRAGVFCDFDGTLSEIVDRPEDARPVAGAVGAMERLARRVAIVAVISGRSLDDLRSRFSPRGVVLAGSYGRERSDRPDAVRRLDVESVAAAAADLTREWDGVVVERKGGGVALHYRLAPDSESDVRRAAARLAREFSLDVRPGRMVAELIEPGPGKAEALATLVSDARVEAFLFGGDDVADGEAFAWARTSGFPCVLVGVRSAESPDVIERDAHVVVDTPDQFVALLERLGALIA
jgi:trehalose 6-phosphate phosphatase